MTMESYQCIQIGASEEALAKEYGKPHSITYLDTGTIVYEYVERFQIGQTQNSIVEIRRYFFYIKDGKVVSKYVRLYDRPGYEFTGEL